MRFSTVDPRWTAAGPWEVRWLLRWYPLGPHFEWCRLSVYGPRQRVPSGSAALATARRLLRRPNRLAALGCERTLEVRDRVGRLAWRGTSEATVREAARLAAGWRGEPPAASSPAAVPVSPPAPTRLTDAQRAVVDHPGGPAVVIAVAGAGKTSTMVARVRALVRAGVPPERVLVTSFSRAAVADVRVKLARAAPPDLGSVDVRTFHSLSHALLREAANVSAPGSATLGSSAIHTATATAGPAPEQVSERLLALACDAWRRSGHPLASGLDALDRDAFLAYRGRCLAHLALPDPDGLDLPLAARRLVRHASPDPDAAIHRPLLLTHEQLRRARGWRDYDDLVVDAWIALMRDATLRERITRRWSHRIVDEFQDVNPAQVALLEALLGADREVMLIGDDDQSIYGFRGSDPTLLHEVGRRLKARRYVLDHNFRGRPEPLAAAADLVERVPGRLPKRLRAARGPGGAVTLDASPGDDAEAVRLVERLRRAHADGFAWERQAVLLRTFAQASVIELALLQAQVPYRLIGAADLPTDPTCRAALAGLHLVTVDVAPRAVRARAWRLWLMGLGMSAGSAASHASELAATGDGGAGALRRRLGRRSTSHDLISVSAATDRLAQTSYAGAAAGLRAAAQELLPWPRRGRAAARLAAFTAAVERGVYGPEAHGAATLLAELAAARRRRRSHVGICITSAHRSKGLEWDVVAVPGQNLGIFPLRDEPEERRLAYVAWTRARERLHLSLDGDRPPSPFLADAGIEELLTLQRDLGWCRSGWGDSSLAAAWAHQDARRRFGGEARGTSAPRPSPR